MKIKILTGGTVGKAWLPSNLPKKERRGDGAAALFQASLRGRKSQTATKYPQRL
jgi:hypothetical protein